MFEIMFCLLAEFYFTRNSYVDNCSAFFCLLIDLIQVSSDETKHKQEQKSCRKGNSAFN